MIDLAVLGQDPRFPGGSRVQTETFMRAATELGRSPHLLWLAYRGLSARPAPTLPGTSFRAVIPGLDGLNQLAAAHRVASPVGSARSAWVVSTVASHGYGAVLSKRPYSVWVGTTLDEEWGARRNGLGVPRRLALAASSGVLRRLERETLRRAARVYATSPASRGSVARVVGLQVSDIELLSIPVDTDTFRPFDDDQWRKELAQPTLAFVGRGDDPRKNLQLLLDAFADIRRRVPDARLRVIGPPPSAAMSGLETPGVEVIGEVPDVASVLRRSAVLVLPSRQEGFGIVAAEALAAGVPVVTTPSGGPEDLVRRSGGGRVLDGFAAEELAEVVTRLLTDEPRLLALRRSGRQFVEREHSLSRFRDRLAAALDEAEA